MAGRGKRQAVAAAIDTVTSQLSESVVTVTAAPVTSQDIQKPKAGPIKVMAVETGFYPKDFRRRKGSVFTIACEEHFSDSQKERILDRVDQKTGKPIKVRTGRYGWMTKVAPETPLRVVTADDANNEAMASRIRAGSPANESVI